MGSASVHRRDEVPPLCAGDRLTVAEFERRYAAMPGLKKAELDGDAMVLPALADALVRLDPGGGHDAAVWVQIVRRGSPDARVRRGRARRARRTRPGSTLSTH